MDNRLNRILHNKPVKLFYFVRNLARYAVPHRLLQKRLEGVLAEVASRDDRDYILQRVDYYNRLPTASNYPPPLLPRACIRSENIASAGVSARPISSIPTNLRAGSTMACCGT